MKTKTVPFVWDRGTKGTHVFSEIDIINGGVLEMKDSAIGRIYLRKSAFGDKVPTFIKVTVEEFVPKEADE